NGSNQFSGRNLLTNKCARPHNIQLLDQNNDGDLDLFVSFFYSNMINLYENLGNGVFDVEMRFIDTLLDVTGNMKHPVIDIDNDGLYDYAYIAINKLVIMKNNGVDWDYTYIDTANIDNICVADYNQDGFADIVAANNYDIFLFLNDGTGNYPTVEVLFSTSEYTTFHPVVDADIDLDGNMDIVFVTDYYQVKILHNNGVGVFELIELAFDLSGSSTNLLVFDIDLDGDLDIINYNSAYLDILENDGDLNFSYNNVYHNWEAGINRVQIADINNDGLPDFIYTKENEIRWFKNLDGSFSSPFLLYSNNDNLTDLKITDLDQDGSLDIVFGTSVSNSVCWIKNYLNYPYKIAGKLYYDENQNGTRDSIEPGIGYFPVSVSPGSLASYSDSEGNYWFAVSVGNYTVNTQPAENWGITGENSSYNVDITVYQMTVDTCDFGFYPESIFDSIYTDIIFGLGMCEHLSQQYLFLRNIGTTSPEVIIELQLDELNEFVSASFPHDSISGNSVFWHIDSLSFFSEHLISYITTWPEVIYMGDSITNVLLAYVLNEEGEVNSVFSDSLVQLIECAYDPNDKSVEPIGFGQQNYIANNQELTYTIRFQNTGNLPATNVRLVDTLDIKLDISTFEFIAASHPVRVILENNILVFEFDSIMLPDSASYEFESCGFAKYKISPNAGLVPNATINNRADIFFDFNPSILTNTTQSTIECWIVPAQPVIEYIAGNLYVTATGSKQWFLNDTIIPGATTSTLFPEFTGSYTVQVTNSYGCSSVSEAFDYTVDNSIIDWENGIRIYPNPTGNFINIEAQDIISIEVLDLTGRSLLKIQVLNDYCKIDLSNFPDGFYFLKTKLSEGYCTHKIFKN
ncbi:MAG: VCBS repeat-containing protein, partial [Bacteroidales bacterium]|nr:VCBS repeat-containing protein [Bacteroidales bacterium]